MKASIRRARASVRPDTHRVRRADRARARALADTVADLIEIPLDAEQFAVACGLRIGRTLRVVNSREMFDAADAVDPSTVCLVTGLALTYRSGDVTILVREGVVGAHRDHVILHELAHVLFEHHPSHPSDLTDRQVHSLFGDLFTPDAVRSLLVGGPGEAHERTGLSTTQEREAEAFAGEMLTRTRFAGDHALRSIATKYGFDRP